MQATSRLKVAQVAPLAEAVPPRLYGGTERVVSWLTEELLRSGHDVTLFASGDSRTDAELLAPTPAALRLAPNGLDPMLAYATMLTLLANRAAEFDVIHFHLDWLHLPLMGCLHVPFLTTLHGRLDLPFFGASISHFGEAPFVSISNSQRRPWPTANWIGTVYHGLPRELLKPCYDPGGYLAFLGRIAPEKGPDSAIRLARAAGMPLKIAAKVDKADEAYFQSRIKPLLDGEDRVELVGEIGEQDKSEFLGKAAALLFPICWPEPFGLVVIEAMACGTPVIAFRAGSVAELIDDGVTGFVIEPGDIDAAVHAIRNISTLDRRNVRAMFERRFTVRRMADDYLRLYRAAMKPGAKGSAAHSAV